MSEGAKVESIEAVKHFKLALLKFAGAVKSAMADVESDMSRTIMWLDTEQSNYWQHQIRKRQEWLMRCKEALRHKQLFKDSTGSRPSIVDEEKAVRQAEHLVAEAQQKLVNVKRYSQLLQKESTLYKGKVQRLYNAVEIDLPVAAAKIEKMIQQLDAYVTLELQNHEVAPSMAQGEDTINPAPAPQEEDDHGSA